MTRRQKDPLRPLTDEEYSVLTKISRAQSEPASHVARAKALLAVACGQSYTAAARAAGRRSNDAVSQLVSRFNREGLAAIEPRHGGGPATIYGATERERILAEFERQPDREREGLPLGRCTRCRGRCANWRQPDGHNRFSFFSDQTVTPYRRRSAAVTPWPGMSRPVCVPS